MSELPRELQRSFWIVARVCPAVAAMLCAATVALVAAEDVRSGQSKPAATASESIDRQLMRDLDNELLDTGPAPKRKATSATPSHEKAGADAGTSGEDIGVPGEANPLLRIVEKMRSAETLIDHRGPIHRTENMQVQIVTDLDALIQKLEEQARQSLSESQIAQQQQAAQREKIEQPQQQGNRAANDRSNQSAKDSTSRVGKNATQKSDAEAAKALMRGLWGQLPARAREEMLQHSPEQFLPQYEILIEKYYQRLAEQQNANP